MRLFPALALALAACGGGHLPCTGPQDCSGNACCYDDPLLTGGPSVSCTGSPQGCPPAVTADRIQTRICRTDADCTAGGITTDDTTCCPAAVLSVSAGTCSTPRCTP